MPAAKVQRDVLRRSGQVRTGTECAERGRNVTLNDDIGGVDHDRTSRRMSSIWPSAAAMPSSMPMLIS